MSKITNTPD